MSDARTQVLNDIRKKAKKINELRTNSKKSLTYNQVLYHFFQEIEEIYIIAKDMYDFQYMLNTRSNLMHTRMKNLDYGVNLKLIWNDTENWKELRLQGVSVDWSSSYLKANPLESSSVYIDVVNMLLEDL